MSTLQAIAFGLRDHLAGRIKGYWARVERSETDNWTIIVGRKHRTLAIVVFLGDKLWIGNYYNERDLRRGTMVDFVFSNTATPVWSGRSPPTFAAGWRPAASGRPWCRN